MTAAPPPQMFAHELEDAAALWLRARFPDAHIVRQCSLAEYGDAIIDVAAICDDQIVGVEVKGDGDSPSRLKLQGQMYSRVCRTVYLLPSPSLYERCRQHKPREWPLLSMGHRRSIYPELRECEHSRVHYPVDFCTQVLKRGDSIGLSPAALAAMIWTKEYSDFARALDAHLPKRKADAIEFVAWNFPLNKIQRAVCAVLRRRDWPTLKNVEYPPKAAA